ncbi:polyphosphate synthetase VTC4 [Cryptosporidium ryanae]|uniref:polyphosphate synthetase VTC4 n=1 Tax=Cryptosporidium ryanae TaxID=515981 RepID=UPI003519DA11|nr:polyphosphate synthetase VTC4 [Cryptosporidium ryanae]
MIPLKEYLNRAPDSNVNYYVDTKKLCETIINLSSQYGPNKMLASEYVRINRIGKVIRVNDGNLPQVMSEVNICDFVFREKLNQEINKVNRFSTTKHEEIYRGIMRIGKSIRTEIMIPIDKFLSEYNRRDAIITGFNGNKADSNITLDPKNNDNVNLGVRNSNIENYSSLYRQKLIQAEKQLNHMSNEIVHLDFYIRTNFKMLTRLCRFFDIMLNSSASTWFQTQLIKEKFVAVNIDILLVLLSLAWKRYRDSETKIANFLDLHQSEKSDFDLEKDKKSKNLSKVAEGKDDRWKPPETFTRSTTKYWVHPNNVVSAKVGIVRYVPYLIFGLSNGELETLLDPYMCVEGHNIIDPNVIEESQPITSVYLDNEDGECYSNRISRFEGAQLFRLRWYGSNEGSKEKEIFMERKTHHEEWTGEKSTKERFSLPQKYVFGYLKGEIGVDYLASKEIFYGDSTRKKVEFALNVQNYITRHNLQPLVRTSYLRAAFQNQDNNQVRFSIDTNLCMVNEYIPNGHANEPWCRFAEEVLSKNEVTRFPYAVLEVKLQSEQPTWVSEMLRRCNATLVYKFSKFQHGMAILHKDKVSALPHWIQEFNNNNNFISCSSISEFGDSRSNYFNSCNSNKTQSNSNTAIIDKLLKSYLNITHFDLNGLQIQWNKTVDDIQYSNNNQVWNNNNDEYLIDSKKIRKIDPKSLFAAERVLLFWIKKCMYISTVLILLLSKAKRKIHIKYLPTYVFSYFEYSLVPLVICVLIYSLLVYFKRCDTIERRMVRSLECEKERIDFPESSFVIFSISCFILVSSLLLNVAIK